MTDRLYDKDSHLREFDARVLSCEEEEGGYAVLLDRTAFFPRGGGQQADTGTLAEARVLEVRERGADILHHTDLPLAPGRTVRGILDWPERFRRMQSHSGEHIVSGIVHRSFGYENVGFHMGAEGVVVDFSGPLTQEELAEVEAQANAAVWEDIPLRCWFPGPEELGALSYRSKLELTENVRLVEIPGLDLCACCAPHVARTGEVGLIRVLESIRRGTGTRVRLLFGENAWRDVRDKCAALSQAAALLSVKGTEMPAAVRRVLAESEEKSRQLAALRRAAVERELGALPDTPGDLCLFAEDYDSLQLREAARLGREKCGGLCAVFTPAGEGFRYVIMSAGVDLRQWTKAINAAIGGRGGGDAQMLQGSAQAPRETILAYFASRTK